MDAGRQGARYLLIVSESGDVRFAALRQPAG
jgi:hypothetical protein